MNINIDSDSDKDTPPQCEHMFIKIKICNQRTAQNNNYKTIIIGNLYRSPTTKPVDSLDKIQQILSRLERHKNKHILLLGDLNIDLIHYETDANSQQLINLTTEHDFIQIISRPTRITDHRTSLIDHIYTNKVQNVTSSGIITYDISDHLATYASISLHDNIHINHDKDDSTNQYNKFNEENIAKFRELIVNETWDDILLQTNTQSKYDTFIQIYITKLHSP